MIRGKSVGGQGGGMGYFQSSGFDSLNPVTKSKIMKAHQITRARSRRIAGLLTGFTNKNIAVRIKRMPPRMPSA
jgi:hypothetical protein